MKKCSLFLTLALLLTMFSGVNLVSAAEVPEGYTEIASAEDFMKKIAADSSGKYYLTADIELPSAYEPIANFSGELIGADETNLKSIKLNVNRSFTSGNNNVGLFGLIASGKVQNIKITGSVTASITGTTSSDAVHVGAFAGKMSGSASLKNCENWANVTAAPSYTYEGSYIGAFAGTADAGTGELSNLSNYGAVTINGGGGYAAGIAAQTTVPILRECYNYGAVTGNDARKKCSGIVGIYKNGTGTVSNCYNAGNITVTGTNSSASGIAEAFWSYDQSEPYDGANCTNFYNIGLINGSCDSPKAIANTLYRSTSYPGVATFTNCFYLSNTSYDDSKEGTEPKTVAELKEILKDTASSEFLEKLEEAQWAGYTKIASAEDFEKIRITPSGKYYLATDIVLPSDYEPIPEFSGELIGADETALKSIALSISGTLKDQYERFGLFKKINGGTIKNIKLTGSVHITGDGAYAGALAGEASGASSIINCVNEANVTVVQPAAGSTDGRAAGLVPHLSATGTLNKLINRGIITLDGGYGAAAGIATIVSNTDLSGCENYGAVSGDNAGGILFNLGNKHTMSNCYNAGEIAGTNAAGIVTALRVWSVGNTPTLTACYNVGTVKNSYDLNPIAATINAGGTVENCSYLNINTAHDDGKDGTTPLTLEQMKALTGSPEAFQNVLNRIYTVTVEEPVNGTLSPSGAFYVKTGRDFSVTANPDDSYRIKDVTANDVSLPGNAGNVYTTPITGNTTIKAEFEKTTQQVPAIAATCEEAFTSTGPVVINGKTITEPMGIVFAKVLTTDGYELTDYGMEFASDQTVLENGEGTAYTAWNVRSEQGNYGVCFYGSFVEGKTYYARPYAVYQKDGATERVYGTTISFVPNPAKGEV